ncbi:MAG TPA: hypothetical protein VGH92_15090, partial [Gaiellaceae bacterium]
MNRALASVAALTVCGPTLLVLAPTRPPHAPLPHLDAAPIGLATGIALFLLLARARPRLLLTPLAAAAALAVAATGMSEEAIWRAFTLARIAPAAGVGTAIAVTSAA